MVRRIAARARDLFPGVGVSFLCVAVSGALVVAGMSPAPAPASHGTPVGVREHSRIHDALVSTNVPTGCSFVTATTKVKCTYASGTTTQGIYIPSHVSTVSYTAIGGHGGANATGTAGGEGAKVTGTLSMSSLSGAPDLEVVVGGNGNNGSGGTGGTGGYYGGAGGAGAAFGGGGGGGRSFIAAETAGAYLVIAGGGGGAGGGAHKDGTGEPGGNAAQTGSAGGRSGTNCDTDTDGGGGGGGGTQNANGSGGCGSEGDGYSCSTGNPGHNGGQTTSQYNGGQGGGGCPGTAGGGGGGGAGYYGGGGGGGGGTDHTQGLPGGGGGGGSSWLNVAKGAGGSFSSTATGPMVTLEWTLLTTKTTVVTKSSTTVEVGDTLAVKAHVAFTPANGTPAGTVKFTSERYTSTTPTTPVVACATAAVSSNVATCNVTVAAPAPGDTLGVFARFNGSGAGRTSTSAVVTWHVVKDATTTDAPTVMKTGTGVKLATTVFPQSYAVDGLAGKVTFQEHVTGTATWQTACAQTIPGGVTPGVKEHVTCKYSTLIPGTKYIFRAVYAGSGDNAASTSGTETYNAAKATTSATVTANGTTFAFGGLVTLSAKVTGIPTADPDPGTVTYENAAGTKLSCLRSGQQNPAPVTASNGKATVCTIKPTKVTAAFKVKLAYGGGTETLAYNTATTTFAVTKQTPKVTLVATSQNGTTSVGEPIKLTATLTDTGVSSSSPTYVTPEVPVKFYAGTTAITGCTSVTPSSGTATCTLAPTPTVVGTTHYHATACPTAGAGPCADWGSATSAIANYTALHALAVVTLSPAGTSTAPAAVQGGHTTTVTASVSFTNGSASKTGKVTFQETGKAVATASGTCATVTVATGKAACTFKPTPGGTSTISATYTPTSAAVTPTVSPASTHLSAKGLLTDVKLLLTVPGDPHPISGGTISYGVPVTATVTVKSPTNTGTTGLKTGNVTVLVNGTAKCSTVSLASGTVTCTLKTLPAGTQVNVSAKYNDPTKHYANGTVTDTLDIAAAPTSVALVVSTSGGNVHLTATVTNTAPGATAPPVGKMAFKAGASTIATCATVSVHTTSGAAAAATCTATIPTTSTTYKVTFTATTGSEFATSTSSPQNFNPGAKCSTIYSAIWNDDGKTFTFSAGTFGSTADAIKVKLASLSGGCRSVFPVTFTNGSLSILGGTITQSSNLTGYVEDATGATDPTVCFTGGKLTLPSSWSLGGITLTATHKLCFDVTGASGTTGSVGKITSGTFSKTGITLPFGTPSAAVTYKMTVSFATTPDPAMTVSLSPTSATTSVYATASITVTDKSKTVTATGTLSLDNVSFGHLNAAFAVSIGKSGSIGGTVTFSAIDTTAPYSPLAGLSFKHVSVTLSKSKSPNLAVSATALVGNGSDPVNVAVTGSYTKPKWTLSVTATRSTAWQPFSSLSISSLTLHGTVVVAPTGDEFDVEMGTPPKKTTPATPIVVWNPLTGLTVDLDCIALAYGLDPTCGHDATTKAETPANPTLVVVGALTIGGTGGLTAGFKGTLDLKSGETSLALDSTVATVKVTPVSGVTLTLKTLKVTGDVGSGLSVSGSASATIPAIGVTNLTVSVTDQSGALTVLVTNISLTSVGIPLTGDFAYASTTVPRYNLTGFGRVTLHKGYNGFAHYTPGSGVQSVLHTIGFTLPTDDVITLTGSWSPGKTPTFTASLNPPTGGVPFLTLPGGATLTGAALHYAKHKLTVKLTGTIPVPSAAAATVSMTLTIGATGTFTGSAKITHLVIFGQTVTLAGTLARSKTGKITGNIKATIPGPFTPFSGVPISFSNLVITAGTSGLGVSGTVSINGLATLKLSGTFSSLSDWTLTVTASAAHSWTPITGVTLSPKFTGKLTDAHGKVTYTLGASGAGPTPLLKLSVGDVSVSVNKVTLGNGSTPTGCKVEHKGDLWLALTGKLKLSFGSVTGTVSVVGCIDITAKSIDLSATLTSFSFSALNTDVKLVKPQIDFSYSDTKGVTVKVVAPIKITMPTGGTVSVTAVFSPEPHNGYVIGAAVNLSSWLGSDADNAYIYYASADVDGFTTGTATLGAIDLTDGINFAFGFDLPTSIISALKDVHINLPAHTSLAAVGTANFETKVYALKVSVSLGTSGITLFTSDGTALDLDSGFLQITLSPGNVAFSMGLAATLHLPAPTSGDAASTLQLTGRLTISPTGVQVSLNFGSCTSTTPPWTNAFGITGLSVKCATLQGGVTDVAPFINIGFQGQITSLPTNIANTIGYINGAPISFAFNLDPFLLSLAIGKKTSTTAALEPLKAFGEGTLMEVDHASLYVSPAGATIGPTTYPAGFGLSFLATIVHVKVNVMANIGFSPPSITFTASVSKITFSVFSIGPVSVSLKASTSPPSFAFKLKGTATLGPASVTLGHLLRVGGKLTATATIAVSTSGFAAFLSGTIDVFVTVYVPTSVCWTYVVPYPCTWQWEGTSVTVHIGRTGFSVTGTGVTLEADTYSITFHYSGGVSVSDIEGAHVTNPEVFVTGKLAPSQVVRSSGTLPTATPHYSLSVRPLGTTPLGTWSTTGSMHDGRTLPTVATLKNGDVLVAGGVGSTGTPLASAEVYDPATKTWSVTGTLHTASAGATATVLDNGDVLIAGGIGTSHKPLATAELYDPSTGVFTATGSMAVARAYASAALLADGDVLVAGGSGTGHQSLATAVLYDPTTGMFSAAKTMPTPRAFAASTTLANGDVLLAGGYGSSAVLATAVLYNASTGSWTAAGSMSQARMLATAARLPDGDVLVVGDGATGDVYDPATNSWTETGGMAVARTMPAVAELPDGDVLVAGGEADGSVEATAEIYQDTTGTWQSAGTMPTARSGGFATVLSNGEVIVGGGSATTGGAPLTSVDVFSLPAKTTPTKHTTTTTKAKTPPTGSTPPPPPSPPPPVVTPTTTSTPSSPPPPTGTPSHPTAPTTSAPTATCAPPRTTPPGSPLPPGSVRDAMAPMANGKGYWLASATGGVFACKRATFYGSPTALRVPVNDIVGIAAAPHGKGYWLVGSDGGIFAFGDAQYYGSLPALGVSVSDIVGIAATPDGKGYWMVARDGGVFAFGDAQFYGSMGGKPLNKPIVGMAPNPDGGGYWLVASDGGIFSFGDAPFHGSTGSITLNKPIVGMTPLPTGGGYWLVASDGGVFAFSAPSFGSTGANPPLVPVLGLVATPTGLGYSVIDEAGTSFHFGA